MDRSHRRFAEFRSISNSLSLKPDTVVLKHFDQVVEAFAQTSQSLYFSTGFVGTMTHHFVEAFRLLDAIDRADPFWDGTNRRPTPYKLARFCEASLRDNLMDRGVPLGKVAVQSVWASFFCRETWGLLTSADRVDLKWIVYSALYAECCGSYETVPGLVSLMSARGLCSQIRLHLNELIIAYEEDRTAELSLADTRHARNWLKRVLDGCGNPF